MRKLYVALVSSLFILPGCSQTYSIHINGYTEHSNLVPNNAKIYVAVEPNASNPILANEVKRKIEKLLMNKNYEVVNTPDAAELRLTYQLGFAPHETTEYEHMRPYAGEHGYMSEAVVPRMGLVWDQWVRLKLYKADKVVWIGEAEILQSYIENRKIVDYLLLGAFEFFGQDSHGGQYIRFEENDPRAVDLNSYTK